MARRLRQIGIFRLLPWFAVCGLAILLAPSILRTQPLTDLPINEAAEPADVATAPSSIQVSSSLVSVPVSVTDASGRMIRDLIPEDFHIAESGQPVTIARMDEARAHPLNLALLFDLSGSVQSRFDFERQAALAFVEQVWKPGDTVSIISFHHRPQVHMNQHQSLEAAMEQLRRLEPTGEGTAFFDSTLFAARLIGPAPPETRQALIVLSDGADNQSDHTLEEALEGLLRSDIVFYAINPSGASVRLNEINRKGQESMSRLAAATGGSVFISDRITDLAPIFSRIAAELRAQYFLSYYSPEAYEDGSFRPITVSLPQKPDLHVRARQGYYATRPDTRAKTF